MQQVKHQKQKSEDFHLPKIKGFKSAQLSSPQNTMHRISETNQDSNYFQLQTSRNHGSSQDLPNLSITTRIINNSFLFKSNMNQLDASIICYSIQDEFQENKEKIDGYETKIARMSPIDYTRIDREIKELMASKDNKKQIDQHTWLIQDHVQILELEKLKIYKLKFPLVIQPQSNWGYPLKVKSSNQEGQKFDTFFSFVEPSPEEYEGQKGSHTWEFLNRKDHIYKFRKPTVNSNFLLISVRGYDFIKVEIKISFSDKNLEKIRNKIQQKIQSHNQYKPLKQKSQKILSKQQQQQQASDDREIKEKEKKQFQLDIQEIIFKRNERMKKFYNVNMLERNIEYADNLNLIKKKKAIDHITHHIKCEEAYRKSVQNIVQGFTGKVSKIFQRNMEKQARKINVCVKNWQTILKFIQIIKYFHGRYEKQIMRYLFMRVFRSRREQIFEKIKKNFLSYRKFDFKIMPASSLIIRDSQLLTKSFSKQVKKVAQKKCCIVIKDFISNGLIEEMLKNIKHKLLFMHAHIKSLQRSFRNKKKNRIVIIQNLIEYQLNLFETQGPSQLEQNQVEKYQDLLPKLKLIQQGHIFQIANNYLNLQKEKCNKLFQLFMEKEEPQEKDYEEIQRILSADQLKIAKANKKQTVTFNEKIEKTEKLQDKDVKILNISSHHSHSNPPVQISNQQQTQLFYKVKIKRLKTPGLHLIKDRNQLKIYLLEFIPRIIKDHQESQQKQELIRNQQNQHK